MSIRIKSPTEIFKTDLGHGEKNTRSLRCNYLRYFKHLLCLQKNPLILVLVNFEINQWYRSASLLKISLSLMIVIHQIFIIIFRSSILNVFQNFSLLSDILCSCISAKMKKL